MERPTLFENERQTMTAGIERTIVSLKAYAAAYKHWVIAYSGGKDSSCVATLVPELIRGGKVPRPESVTVLYADTRMELPPLQQAAFGVMDRLEELGCRCRVVLPAMEKRFFVYMFGLGVPPPSNTFRWCTGQIKIKPMLAELASLREEYGQKFLMLTGVRLGESAARDARIALSCGKNGAECGQGWFQEETPEAVADTLAPVLHWRVCHVWKWLRQWAPMAGYPTERVADAYGGKEAEEINARTGCVGCNLASRDRALETLLKEGRWQYLSPLLDLRELYAELKRAPNRLRKTTLQVTKAGKLSKNQGRMGPLTFEARRMGLARVLEIQDEVNAGAPAGTPSYLLINEEERAAIEKLIDAEAWPRGWDGTEQVADVPFDEYRSDGSMQPLLAGLGE